MTDYKRPKPERIAKYANEERFEKYKTAENHLAEALENLEGVKTHSDNDFVWSHIRYIEHHILAAWEKMK